MSADQRRVLTAIMQCRTAALGGHKRTCTVCGHEEIAYNSCRSRHCPKCQATAQAEWLSARVADLLPVPYFHVVFTLPDELRPLALTNKKTLYGLLFQVSTSTIDEGGILTIFDGMGFRLSWFDRSDVSRFRFPATVGSSGNGNS